MWGASPPCTHWCIATHTRPLPLRAPLLRATAVAPLERARRSSVYFARALMKWGLLLGHLSLHPVVALVVHAPRPECDPTPASRAPVSTPGDEVSFPMAVPNRCAWCGCPDAVVSRWSFQSSPPLSTVGLGSRCVFFSCDAQRAGAPGGTPPIRAPSLRVQRSPPRAGEDCVPHAPHRV